MPLKSSSTTSDNKSKSSQYVLVLVSKQSFVPQVLRDQENALRALESNAVRHVVLDGTAASNQARANRLFAISGLFAQYPQFFLVQDNDDDNAKFWGDYQRFEDEKHRIADEFGVKTPVVSFSPLSPSSSSSSSWAAEPATTRDVVPTAATQQHQAALVLNSDDQAASGEKTGESSSISLKEENGNGQQIEGQDSALNGEKIQEQSSDLDGPPLLQGQNSALSYICLALYTCFVVSIPLVLLFGAQERRPRLTQLVEDTYLHLTTTPLSQHWEALAQDLKWRSATQEEEMVAVGSSDDDDDDDDVVEGRFSWQNPLSDSQFFDAVFRGDRRETKNSSPEQSKQSGESKQSAASGSKNPSSSNPFDWFDGSSPWDNEDVKAFFRKVALFFEGSIDDSDPSDRQRGKSSSAIEQAVTSFLMEDEAPSPSILGAIDSFGQMVSLLTNSTAEVLRQVNQTLGHVVSGDRGFNLLQFLYFMDDEESRKNAVWKRRQHRFQPELPLEAALQLHDGLYLSQLAYAPSCEEIARRVQEAWGGLWTLRNCTVQASVHQPAHFVLVRRKQLEALLTSRQQQAQRGAANWLQSFAGPSALANKAALDQQLEVAIVIRGSKEIFDFLTDGMLLATEYQGGKAHDGILKSAQWLERTYRADLKRFWNQSQRKAIAGSGGKSSGMNHKPLKLWLIGHSLGGGTAALGAMEFRHRRGKWCDAEALGFGTPSLVSPGLSTKYRDYVTTVINDADLVPRTSGAVLAKAWMRIVAFNWTNAALQDYDQLVAQVQSDTKLMKFLGRQGEAWLHQSCNNIRRWLETWFDDNVAPLLETNELALPQQGDAKKTFETELIPPGECIHFYRDGVNYQATYVDKCGQFFDELEIVRHFVDDHLIPPGYYQALLGLVRHRLDDASWTFDNDIMEIDFP